MDELRNKAKQLLETQAVNVVIGYGEGTSGTIRAIFARKPEQADKLIFDSRCDQNLAVYLLKHEIKHMGKKAVVATIPIVRSILQVASECQLQEEEVIALVIADDGKILELNSFKAMEDFLAPENVGIKADDIATLQKLDAMSIDEKWEFWKQELGRCIKCYACRAACPMCYCTRCFVEVNTPQWIPISANDLGSFEWHILRAMHLAGRCINCGACGTACPVDIPIHLLTFKTVEDVQTDFNVVAGMKHDMPSVLSSYKVEDKETFIR